MSYETGPETGPELGSILDMFSKKKKKEKKEKAKKAAQAYVDKLTDVASRIEAAKALPGAKASTIAASSSTSETPAWLKWGLLAGAAFAGWKLWSTFR